MNQKEQGGFGDFASITLNAGASAHETVGIEGHYHVECRDKDGNLKWEESFPNLVNAVGKQLMLNTLLVTASGYTLVGPFLGLIDGASPTFAAADTMTSHGGWTEFTNYTVGGSAVRGTAVFSSATSTGTTPTNVTTCAAASITYTITGAGGTVGGCFLNIGGTSAQGNTTGTLYSAGAFTTAKITTAGDTVAVTYSTTATS